MMLRLLLEISFDISKKNIYSYKKVTDNEYTFKIGEDTDEKKYSEYIVKFTIKDAKNPTKYERDYVPIGKEYTDLTNEGKARKVIATVTAITIDFMKSNKDWKILTIVPVNQKRYNIVKQFFDSNKEAFIDYYIDEKYGEEFHITKKIKKHNNIKK